MQNNDGSEKYYSPEARAIIKDGRKEWTPELLANAQQDWLRLFHDVEAALEEDPASEAAQALGIPLGSARPRMGRVMKCGAAQ